MAARRASDDFLSTSTLAPQKFRLRKSGGDDNTRRLMKEMSRRQLLSHSEGEQLRLENRQHNYVRAYNVVSQTKVKEKI